ncbi:hypothetical protein B0H19DRAFT_1180143 [Mycena capillaripes]|nr:hypothetical protein B0H19DRAFT_1180143 [Mycena capillaripes]
MDANLEWDLLEGEWKEFHDEWWGKSDPQSPWSIRQPQVREALGMSAPAPLVFDQDLYDRVRSATHFAAAGIIVDPGVGIDGSTLRAFFLRHIMARKACYFTSYSLITYMADEDGVWWFPTERFRLGHYHLPIINGIRPWSFVDILPSLVHRDYFPSHERIYPPYSVDSRTTFSLILADPQIKWQYHGWMKKVLARRWTTVDDTFTYIKLIEDGL